MEEESSDLKMNPVDQTHHLIVSRILKFKILDEIEVLNWKMSSKTEVAKQLCRNKMKLYVSGYIKTKVR